MSERTDWDETVDEAIEVLIADSTDAFVLMGRQGDETHLIEAVQEPTDRLLAIWMLVSREISMLQESGEEIGPQDVLANAYLEAGRRGYLEGSVDEYR